MSCFPGPGRGIHFSEGEKNLHSVECAAGYVWAGCCTSPSLLLRIDSETGGYERIEFEQGGGLHDLAFDGERLWAAHASGHVSRVDPRTCAQHTTKVDVASGETAFLYAAAPEGRGVWICTYTDPGRVLRVGLDGRIEKEFVLPGAPMWSLRDLAYHDGFLWVTAYTARGKVVKIHTDTGDHETIDLGDDGMLPNCLEFDGTHLWVGLDTMPAKLVRIDVRTHEHTTYALHAQSSCVRDLVCAGGCLWAGLYTEPGELLRFDPHAKEFDVVVMPEGFFNVRSLACDGKRIWAGLQNIRYGPSGVYSWPVAEEES